MTLRTWILVAIVGLAVVALLVWLFGVHGGIAGALSAVGAVLLGRRKAKQDEDKAQARLDAAVELGMRDREDADEKGEAEVANGMERYPSLSDYLNDRTGND